MTPVPPRTYTFGRVSLIIGAMLLVLLGETSYNGGSSEWVAQRPKGAPNAGHSLYQNPHLWNVEKTAGGRSALAAFKRLPPVPRAATPGAELPVPVLRIPLRAKQLWPGVALHGHLIGVGPDHLFYFSDGRRIFRGPENGALVPYIGALRGRWGDVPRLEARLSLVLGCTWDAKGQLYFTDRDHIRTLTPDGNLKTLLAHPGAYPKHQSFFTPQWLACDREANLYAAASLLTTVARLAPDGSLKRMGFLGSRPTNVHRAGRLGTLYPALSAFAVSPDGTCYLGDRYMGVIWRTRPGEDAVPLAYTPIVSDKPWAILPSNGPVGLALDRRGQLYVALCYGTVMAVGPRGQLVEFADLKKLLPNTPASAKVGLVNMFIGSDDSLYVITNAGQTWRIS